MRKIIYIVLISVTSIRCVPKRDDQEKDAALSLHPKNDIKDFNYFMVKFSSDSMFQRSHISEMAKNKLQTFEPFFSREETYRSLYFGTSDSNSTAVITGSSVNLLHFHIIDQNRIAIKTFMFVLHGEKWILENVDDESLSAGYFNNNWFGFLREFINDSAFRKKSIQFPLLEEGIEEDGTAYSKKISISDYEEIPLVKQMHSKLEFWTATTLGKDDFENRLKKSASITILSRSSGLDNYRVQYIFEAIDKKWQLIRIADFST
ncbi:MAG: DUF4348 domain-containing protein [Bacteroidia bacterium]